MRTRTALMLACLGVAMPCLAGTPQKWDDLPGPVRATVLAHGGKEGMTVDKESAKIGGKSVYEAGVKGKDGRVVDLVIAEDGTLVETKTDDAADRVAERRARASKLIKGVTFSHPRQVDNPYLPLSTLKRDVLEGVEDGKKFRVERSVKPDVRKRFPFGEAMIESLAVEDRVSEDGVLSEIAVDYFAQDDEGNVYYLGEDVDVYEGGKVVSHEGAWLLGKDTAAPGLLFPAKPSLGQRWRSEDVSEEISETDEVVSLSVTVTTPAGTFAKCVQVKETFPDGTTELKYYAPGVGVVREQPHDGDVLLKSHETATGR